MFSSLWRWWKNKRLRATYGRRLSCFNQIMKQLNDISGYPEIGVHIPEALERIEYLFSRGVVVFPIIDESSEVFLVHEPVDSSRESPHLRIFLFS